MLIYYVRMLYLKPILWTRIYMTPVVYVLVTRLRVRVQACAHCGLQDRSIYRYMLHSLMHLTTRHQFTRSLSCLVYMFRSPVPSLICTRHALHAYCSVLFPPLSCASFQRCLVLTTPAMSSFFIFNLTFLLRILTRMAPKWYYINYWFLASGWMLFY